MLSLCALNGQVFRHDQNHSIALDGGAHGQCNTRVARCGFNQGVARLNFTALFGPLNHGKSRPVFE